MVSPISNDKILPQNSDRPAAASKRSSGEENSAAGRSVTRPTDDSVELSNASLLSNRETTPTRNGGTINSLAEARDLVVQIKAQIESAGAEALKSHGLLESGSTTTLLDTSAA